MPESPVRKPDWLGHKRLLSLICLCIELDRICSSFFLWIGTTLAFFHSLGNIPSFRQFLKMISSGFQMESPHNFNIRMLIMSCPWALLGSSFLIISPMWSAEKWNDSRSDSVWTVKTDGSLLSFTRGVHWSAKYELKRSHFFLMSDTNLSLW